ncbi:unnamed protein product [Mytilus edulis]|uniref:Uncharacterized protein n=1 Tax=Mytilus edulis TaxID=6550 RepID=A0A8S3QCM0_MYTED|nr:unnamed protein product [Mytilus edulis]
MPIMYSVLFFYLSLGNEVYFAFKQYGSLTDKSHCSSPLWSTYLRNELDEAVIIWQGAKIEECRVVRPFEETGQMCVRIVTNNISCDQNVTLTLFNQPLGDLVIMTYLVGCNVNPVQCLVFKSNVMFKIKAPNEIATHNDAYRLRLEIIVTLLPTITKDVWTVTAEYLLKNYEGVCKIPVDRPDIYFVTLEYCLIYKCSTLVDCIAAYNYDLLYEFNINRYSTPATPRLHIDDNHDNHDNHDNYDNHEKHDNHDNNDHQELPTTESKLGIFKIIRLVVLMKVLLVKGDLEQSLGKDSTC